MPPPAPIYTAHNCSVAYQLNWVVSVFWREPVCESPWLSALADALEDDDIRLLKHRFSKPGTSQFLVSTRPEMIPEVMVGRVKGRLQYLVRRERPKALKRNYAVESIGSSRREAIEKYIETQLDRYRVPDCDLRDRLLEFQIRRPEVELGQWQRTARGLYMYNLHLVLETDHGWAETRSEFWGNLHAMIPKIADVRGHRLSRAAILPDHLHFALGCPIAVAPLDIALCYLNNLAYLYGMKPLYRFSAYVGTFGEYNLGVAGPKTRLEPEGR